MDVKTKRRGKRATINVTVPRGPVDRLKVAMLWEDTPAPPLGEMVGQVLDAHSTERARRKGFALPGAV
jgi:hypothetical protein